MENTYILEDIDPFIADKVPMLSKLDPLLKVDNGFWYILHLPKLDKEIESVYMDIHKKVYL
ncbi:MAG TPA: hypothetical protein EYO73_07090 [Sulfurimonas sp.]|nr:hypothetical protein [Sulfurimonas sp.]